MKHYLRLFLTACCLWGACLNASKVSAQTNGLLRDVFLNIGGGTIADLQSHAGWPVNPDMSGIITDGFVSYTNAMDHYGQRIRGFIIPPQTGDYVFWISSDDNSILYLSSDEQPESKLDIAWVSSWTPAMTWNYEPNQQSKAIHLETNRIYYIEALMAEGNGGDNLAVRWMLPDGTIEEPIPNSRVYPWGTAFVPPEILVDPTNTVAVEGGSAIFNVVAKTSIPATFQWQKNGTNIVGATNATLHLSNIPLTDDAARYRCLLINNKGSVLSAEATLSVTPDQVAPQIVSVINIGLSNLNVVFSQPVQLASATKIANYRLDQDRSILTAVLGSDLQTVTLTTSPLSYDGVYTLTINGIQDRAATPNTIAPNSQISFTMMSYSPVAIGDSSLNGAAVSLTTNDYNLSGAGTNIDGTADQFFFAYQIRSGDFDVQVRIEGFDGADVWAKAGLMARETLDPGSRYAATLSTPSMSGCFFQSRSVAKDVTTTQGSFPVNYPNTWLRLQRVGSVFSGYASIDGQAWTLLGTVTVQLPNTLYFGMAAAGHSSTAMAAIQFRNIVSVVDGTIGTTVFPNEPLGPSSRHTGLVISEIFYHPPTRADGRNLEFVEIYNSNPYFEDISDYRLSGAISNTFPKGTILRGGAFLVVARVPEDVRSVYGITNVIGAYTGALQNGSGTVRLRNHSGAVLLEANYSGNRPWPAAADGAGHSLVLARPSYGERNAAAWDASDLAGGSPGKMEVIRSNPYQNILINEFLAHTDDPELDFVELYNHSNQRVDLSGCVLSDDPAVMKFRFPTNTSIDARGFLSFTQTQMGFALHAAGETIYLFNPDQTRVIDAIRFGPQPLGVSSGRCPDGSSSIQQLAAKTPNAANSGAIQRDVIINEIMYHPISGNNDDEYIEIYNRGTQPLFLDGWRFTDGIQFEFPTNTLLGSGGYLVVARNAAHLMTRYPNLTANNTLGNYTGSLNNGGERLVLAKPEELVSTNSANVIVTNKVYVEINSVAYSSGGKWPEWADGSGSSLELRDPRGDNQLAANWADSIETNKAPWTTIETTGVLDFGNPNRLDLANLQLVAQGPGEYLVDNVELFKSGSGNLLLNANFEIGTNGWISQGNHYLSGQDNSGGYGGGKCLHVRAQDRGDTGLNHIYSLYPNTANLAPGDTATLRARVRWLKGWPEFSLRLRGNWLEAAGSLTLPTNLGTPGAKNSTAVDNAGPAIYDVVHSPVLPAANQPVVVTARVSDPNGLVAFNLYYRVDPSNVRRQVPLVDDGTGGDAVAGDGLYSATVPGQTNGAMAAFYIQGTDASYMAASSRFPSDAPAREALVRWGEPQPVGNLGAYHLWISQQILSQWAAGGGALNNFFRDATFVYGNNRVIYNFQIHDKGSPWHGGSGDYYCHFPPDDLWLGESSMVLASPGNGDNDDMFQHEQHAFWILGKLGVPALYRRFMHLYKNGSHYRRIMEDSQEPNRDLVRAWFPDDSDGDFYKIDDWFEFNDNATSFTSMDATLQKFADTNGVFKLARYRWNWRKRAVQDSANNYTNLFALVQALDSSRSNYVANANQLADMDEWMRVFALQHIVGNWDSYGYRRGKNSYAYKPEFGKWSMLAFDIDFVLGLGSDGYTTPFFTANDPVITNAFNTAEFKRDFLRALHDAAYGPMMPEQSSPLLDSRYEGLAANGIPVKSPAAMKTWIANRRSYILAELTNYNATLAVDGSLEFSVAQSSVTLKGTAPVDIKTIDVNGISYPIVWPSVTGWSMTVPLAPGANRLVINGLDSYGKPGTNSSVVMGITNTSVPEYAPDKVVINEIMYHPAIPNTEFVEILSTSAYTTFDVSGWHLNGVSFTFAPGTLIGPQQFLLVVKDPVAFATAYGSIQSVVGQFTGQLQNDGETLTLLQPGATPEQDLLIDQVTYSDQAPWPANADGFGPSLQLIDPSQDNRRAGNWAASATNAIVLATPGAKNSVYAAIPAIPPLWINEIQPANVNGPVDHAGNHGPWIEIYNAGNATFSLNGWFLSDNYTNLSSWAFPNNAQIQPGQFLVVWVDGQPNLSTADEWHASFRLSTTNGAIVLSRSQFSSVAVMDYLNYPAVASDRSYGAYPDGQPRLHQMFYYPTPRAANNPASPVVMVSVNEWMAASSGIEDWFELYNAGSTSVDLSGYYLTDDLTNFNQFTIPSGFVIPAKGFLLVWADGHANLNNPTNPVLHVDFKLKQSGEAIGLFAPDGALVHGISFGPQRTDFSEGLYPDGARDSIGTMTIPTPGKPNVGELQGLHLSYSRHQPGQLTFSWPTEAGLVYRLEYSPNLTQSNWLEAITLTAMTNSVSVTNAIDSDPIRVYRVKRNN